MKSLQSLLVAPLEGHHKSDGNQLARVADTPEAPSGGTHKKCCSMGHRMELSLRLGSGTDGATGDETRSLNVLRTDLDLSTDICCQTPQSGEG